MIMNIYRPGFRLILLPILLFALTYTNGYATNQTHESSLTLSSSTAEEVIYLAQSSDEEDPEKKILLEEDEEEEEPDCD